MVIKKGDRVQVNCPGPIMGLEAIMSPFSHAAPYHEKKGVVLGKWDGFSFVKFDTGIYVNIPDLQLIKLKRGK